MQLRRLAALERQKIIDELRRARGARSPSTRRSSRREERQRQIVCEELAEIVDKYGDERRTQIVPADGDMSHRGPHPRGGRRRHDHPRRLRQAHQGRPLPLAAARRQGRPRRAAARRTTSSSHFFVTTTHHWLLFFTNLGRVYRAKAYELPEAGRDAKGQHVANLLAFQPGEEIAQVLDLRDYEQAPYLVLATQRGLVKKTRLTEYDSNRTGGVIAINLREERRRADRRRAGRRADDDLLLVSPQGAVGAVHRPTTSRCGRWAGPPSGVTGMRFRAGDELLSMGVVRAATARTSSPSPTAAIAKRSRVEEYRVQGRGGLGIKATKIAEDRGVLVGGAGGRRGRRGARDPVRRWR